MLRRGREFLVRGFLLLDNWVCQRVAFAMLLSFGIGGKRVWCSRRSFGKCDTYTWDKGGPVSNSAD
jgi:hypothetical protein